MKDTFARDIDKGLSLTPKSLPSRYFYDKKGDELFVKIMNMPEYYLTDAELEIFKEQTEHLIQSFAMNGEHFEVVELGAGDGLKVVNLLRGLNGSDFTYSPIDISANAIDLLHNRLNRELPGLQFGGRQGEYFEVLESLRVLGKKIILFLGSNIGNLTDNRAHDFLTKLADAMVPTDKLLIGFDLKKDPEIIRKAYDDPHGYTREFNLNLLHRINRELGGDFDVSQFAHKPLYNEATGEALSYLQSYINQTVTIKATGQTYHFKKGECIHTEISRKYDLNTIQELVRETGLLLKDTFYDKKKYFVDVLFEKI